MNIVSYARGKGLTTLEAFKDCWTACMNILPRAGDVSRIVEDVREYHAKGILPDYVKTALLRHELQNVQHLQ